VGKVWKNEEVEIPNSYAGAFIIHQDQHLLHTRVIGEDVNELLNRLRNFRADEILVDAGTAADPIAEQHAFVTVTTRASAQTVTRRFV
jgi:hypothetical protein